MNNMTSVIIYFFNLPNRFVGKGYLKNRNNLRRRPNEVTIYIHTLKICKV